MTELERRVGAAPGVMPSGVDRITHRPVSLNPDVVNIYRSLGSHFSRLHPFVEHLMDDAAGLSNRVWQALPTKDFAPENQSRFVVAPQALAAVTGALRKRNGTPLLPRELLELGADQLVDKIFPIVSHGSGLTKVDQRVGVFRVASKEGDPQYLVIVEMDVRDQPGPGLFKRRIPWGGAHAYVDAAVSAFDPQFGPPVGDIMAAYGIDATERLPRGQRRRIGNDPRQVALEGLRTHVGAEEVRGVTATHLRSPDHGVDLARRVSRGLSEAGPGISRIARKTQLERLLENHEDAIRNGAAPASLQLASGVLAERYLQGLRMPPGMLAHVEHTYSETIRQVLHAAGKHRELDAFEERLRGGPVEETLLPEAADRMVVEPDGVLSGYQRDADVLPEIEYTYEPSAPTRHRDFGVPASQRQQRRTAPASFEESRGEPVRGPAGPAAPGARKPFELPPILTTLPSTPAASIDQSPTRADANLSPSPDFSAALSGPSVTDRSIVDDSVVTRRAPEQVDEPTSRMPAVRREGRGLFDGVFVRPPAELKSNRHNGPQSRGREF